MVTLESNGGSDWVECSATTIEKQLDQLRLCFWTLRGHSAIAVWPRLTDGHKAMNLAGKQDIAHAISGRGESHRVFRTAGSDEPSGRSSLHHRTPRLRSCSRPRKPQARCHTTPALIPNPPAARA